MTATAAQVHKAGQLGSSTLTADLKYPLQTRAQDFAVSQLQVLTTVPLNSRRANAFKEFVDVNTRMWCLATRCSGRPRKSESVGNSVHLLITAMSRLIIAKGKSFGAMSKLPGTTNTCSLQQATCSLQPGHRNVQSAHCNEQPADCNEQVDPCNEQAARAATNRRFGARISILIAIHRLDTASSRLLIARRNKLACCKDGSVAPCVCVCGCVCVCVCVCV